MLDRFPGFVIALVFCFAAVARAQQAETFREWTSADGRKLEAALVGVEGGMVRLKLRTGAVVPLPLARLSPEDQAFARKAVPATVPSAAAGKTDGGPGAPGAFAAEKTWPRTVTVGDLSPVTVVKEDAGEKKFIYRSEHYEFRCDSKLNTNVVREFNRIFEATHLVNCKLPLDLQPSPEEGQQYFVANLYTKQDDFFANGGLKGSAGVYQSGQKALSVPLASLGVKLIGTRVTLEPSSEKDNSTLVHEITHQMMNHWLPHLPVWYIEGSAEYIAILKYEHGRFGLAVLGERLRHYLQWQGGDGKHFTMLDLGELTSLDDATWEGALANSVEQSCQNYASAALLTYYFYHMDDKGDAAHMIAYLRAVEKTDKKEDMDAAFKKHLLRDRTFETLKAEVKKGLRKEGLEIEFASPGKNARTSSASK